jgi:hypothetical protein
MKRKVGVISALAIVASSAGITTPVLSQESESLVSQCERYWSIDDREVLQQELSELLLNDPSNVCIDQIVSKLGGSPIAQVQQVASATDVVLQSIVY